MRIFHVQSIGGCRYRVISAECELAGPGMVRVTENVNGFYIGERCDATGCKFSKEEAIQATKQHMVRAINNDMDCLQDDMKRLESIKALQ
jgi:hypothetical protein